MGGVAAVIGDEDLTQIFTELGTDFHNIIVFICAMFVIICVLLWWISG